MTSQSVAPLDVEEAQVDREVVATICLTEKSGSAGMVVALFASEDDVASLAGGILGEDVGIDGGHSTHSVNC